MMQLQEFIIVFGQRFVGLVDNAGIYNAYRVPVPEAPYPQDYVIDQQGNIAYWSDEYDPQEIMRVIDRLLQTSVEETEINNLEIKKLDLNITPNPACDKITVKFQTPNPSPQTMLSIYDSSGRLVKILNISGSCFLVPGEIQWDLTDQQGNRAPSGTYFVHLQHGYDVVTESFVVTR